MSEGWGHAHDAYQRGFNDAGAIVEQQTVERCASVCNSIYLSDDKTKHGSMYQQGFEWAAEKCEQAIRALLEPKP